MSFDSVAAETSLQYVQSENVLSIPAINYSPRTLEQSRLEFNNCSLNRDEIHCSQYRQSTYVSPLSSYVSKTTSSNNMHVMASGNHNHSSGLMDADTQSNDCTVITSNLAGRPYTPFGMLCNNGLALSMSCFPQHIFHPEEPKPQYSYIGLIAMAILSSAETKLVLSDIYQYILDNYPYFRARGPGWRNSIRHNLSLNDCFLKSGRSANGKGHYWGIHPANIDDFRKGDFRRRKAQRKVRKHMGLPLDAVGPDSPSPPPPQIDITSPPTTMVSTISLNIPPTSGSASETSYEYPVVQNGLPPNCIQQKHQLPHYQHLLPSTQLSLPYTKHRQQIHDSYFGSAIMEHYSSVPASFHNNNRHTTSILSHKQCSGYQNHKLFNSFTNNNALLFLAQQNSNDKPLCCSRTAAKSSSNELGSMAGISPQKHKRQFDVASLLAPDRNDFDSKTPSKEVETTEMGIATVQHTKDCRSVNDNDHQTQPSQYCKQLLHRQLFVTSALQQQIRLTRDDQEEEEIVDVVASDIVDVVSSNIGDTSKQDSPLILVDKENNIYGDKMHVKKGSQTFHGDNKGCEDTLIYSDCSLPTKSNLMQEQYTEIPKMVPNAPASLADFQTCYASKFISASSSTHLGPVLSKTVKTASILDYAGSESRNNGIHQMQLYSHLGSGNTMTSHSIAQRNKHVKRLIHQFHKHNTNLAKLDADLNIQSFGHYYGSYMAAAAAHIETMQMAELQRQKLPMKIQPKLQNRQQ